MKSGNYEKVFEISRNLCHVPEKSANFIEKAAIDTLKKCSNFAVNCPFKKVFLIRGHSHWCHDGKRDIIYEWPLTHILLHTVGNISRFLLKTFDGEVRFWTRFPPLFAVLEITGNWFSWWYRFQDSTTARDIDLKFYMVLVLGKLEDTMLHFPAGTVHKYRQSLKKNV